jgi:hypothetical protein
MRTLDLSKLDDVDADAVEWLADMLDDQVTRSLARSWAYRALAQLCMVAGDADEARAWRQLADQVRPVHASLAEDADEHELDQLTETGRELIALVRARFKGPVPRVVMGAVFEALARGDYAGARQLAEE